MHAKLAAGQPAIEDGFGVCFGFQHRAEQVFSRSFSSTPGLEKEGRVSGAVYVDLGLRTLQMITASISTRGKEPKT